MVDIEGVARKLDDAARNAAPVSQLGHLSEAEAYAVQAASINRRLTRGERRIGVKMGLTSRAKMAQMGVHDMIWGRLTDAMLIEDGGSLLRHRYIHPRVEPEIAFLIGSRLQGKVTPQEAHAAIAGTAPALEVIDSRYQDFKFSLTDVVADNASSCAVVLGPWTKRDVDISNLGMVLSFNGEEVQVGSTAAILGHPLRALVAAVRLMSASGESLMPGDIVLAGAATPAEKLAAGTHVRLDVRTLGSVEFWVAL